MNVSVDPHQIVTRRDAPDVFLNVADVVAYLLGKIHLVLALLHVRPVDLLHVVVIEDRLARLNLSTERA